MKKLLIPALALLTVATAVQAETYAVDFSAWSPTLQMHTPADDVGVFRLAIYGANNDVTGLDLGIVNISAGEFNGLQYAWAYGQTDKDFNGVQLGIMSHIRGDMCGADVGIINFVEGKTCGLMGGFFVNWADGEMNGLELAFINCAANLNGVQFGLVNWAKAGYGLQIGLINIFGDGFLPVFPFINFNF